MFSLFTRENEKQIDISFNTEKIRALPKQTVLQTALDNNVAFAFNCRVGSCGTCKCRLVDGEIRELTDPSYTLNEKELAQGFILACQSVPKANLVIEYDAEKAARIMSKKIAAEEVAASKSVKESE